MVEPNLNREGLGQPGPSQSAMDIHSEITRAKQFWSPKDVTEAREMILPVEDWINYTAQAMNLLITPKVKELLKPESDGTLGTDSLEIGAGIGRLLPPMRLHFGTAWGIDISDEMVEMSTEYLKGYDSCHVVPCNGNTFPFGADNFDFVYSIICFQHIHSLEMIRQYLSESFRVLAPGGVVRIQTYKGMPQKNGYQGHFFPSITAFSKLFKEAGFIIVEEQEGLGHPDYLWITAQKPRP